VWSKKNTNLMQANCGVPSHGQASGGWGDPPERDTQAQ